MTSSLVGSEMCIRDSTSEVRRSRPPDLRGARRENMFHRGNKFRRRRATVSYTHLTLPTICSV
eukprot:4534932-Prorocentrum_lima.AAC.1